MDRQRHKHIRLAGYDYSQAGTYAFTIVVQARRCCFGAITEYEFIPAPAGDIVRDVWEHLPDRFPTILLDAFVVMPNHIHGIVLLGANPGIAEEIAINGDATGLSESVPHTGKTNLGQTSSVASPFMATVDRNPPPDERAISRLPQPPSRNRIAPALGEVVRSLKVDIYDQNSEGMPP